MACDACVSDVFKQKIGRCKTCMWQLTVLSVVCWPSWFYFFYDQPTSVNSIALLFFSGAFTGLLTLHLLVLSWRKLTGRQ
ncbi:DUF3624 domain-containing protein [Shewanella sp. C32]|uniref:DUF3624 domain-containing protein n=1 Tax=Shewanella electrica TaxID=515560 RepID=A0ABT2FIT1_9GAMM|nr:DUF3624 domain-containing protein [Shewanella electrica]MCH1924343.1 DUF3624 domain-containing protein [Shewanella electrica]MCS4556244.1 DUF3624 domain-containing protein [Shewanella electrica]